MRFTETSEAAKYQHQISTNNNFSSAPIESSRKFQLRNAKESNDKEQTLINEINRLIKIKSAKRRMKEKPLKSIETTLGICSFIIFQMDSKFSEIFLLNLMRIKKMKV